MYWIYTAQSYWILNTKILVSFLRKVYKNIQLFASYVRIRPEIKIEIGLKFDRSESKVRWSFFFISKMVKFQSNFNLNL